MSKTNETTSDGSLSKSWADDSDKGQSKECPNHLADELVDELEEDGTHSSMSQTGTESIKEQSMNIERTTKRTIIVALCVVLIGAAASTGFLYVGTTSARKRQTESFQNSAKGMVKSIQSSFKDYEHAALWVHQSCYDWRTTGYNQTDFRLLYEYIISGGLQFDSVQWVPNVTNSERKTIENETYNFFASNPAFDVNDYHGFKGLQPSPEDPSKLELLPRSKQPFYFPIMFVQPLYPNDTGGLDLDLYSNPPERPTILHALKTNQPTLTPRFRLVSEKADRNKGYSVVLYHPGPNLSESFHIPTRDLSNLLVKVDDLVERAVRSSSESLGAYLYDITDKASGDFLGGIKVFAKHGGKREFVYPPEVNYTDVRSEAFAQYHEEDIEIGFRTWKIVVTPVDGTYKARLTFVLLAGIMVFVASILMAIWMVYNMHRSIQMHRVMTKAAAEAAIVTNLFPADVRERMIRDAAAKNNKVGVSRRQDVFLNNGKGGPKLSQDRLDSYLTSEGIFGSKPIAELYPHTTIM